MNAFSFLNIFTYISFLLIARHSTLKYWTKQHSKHWRVNINNRHSQFIFFISSHPNSYPIKCFRNYSCRCGMRRRGRERRCSFRWLNLWLRFSSFIIRKLLIKCNWFDDGLMCRFPYNHNSDFLLDILNKIMTYWNGKDMEDLKRLQSLPDKDICIL